MNVQQTSNQNNIGSSYHNKDIVKTNDELVPKNSDHAAIYDKSNSTEKTYQRDQATIDRLISEAEASTQQLRSLVERMLLKQGKTIDMATDIYGLLREGKVEVDEETRLQAQKDIGENGYWGVEETSERLFSFAKALSGGDPSKADDMIKAVKKGFGQAEKSWGGKLPQISRDTLDRTISKMESWRDSLGD